MNPYNFAAYLIIPVSNPIITSISAKGIGTNPAKEDIIADLFIWVSILCDAFAKKSSFDIKLF